MGSNVRSFIGGKTPEQREASIKIIEALVDDFRNGTINAIVAVGVKPTDDVVMACAHTRDSFTVLSQLGAVSALNYWVQQRLYDDES